jgi:signal transduction histidine kinase
MKARKRSPEQVAREFEQLQTRPSNNRDRRSLLHDVSVYQEELAVQNEALTRAQSTLEGTRQRFVELYDFAPNGYLVLDRNGIVRHCNLTAATWLGRPRETLRGLPLHGWVVAEDRAQFVDFLRRCRSARGEDLRCELTMSAGDRLRRMQLLCRARRSNRSSRFELLASLVDVTEPMRLESERARIARERAALASRLISVQDEERQRIARNLHDDIGQQVTAIRLNLDALEATSTEETLRTAVVRAQAMLEQLDRSVHVAARDLRPSLLDFGIVAAIDQFVRDWSKAVVIPASFHPSGMEGIDLPPVVDTHLYRIAQEALNNVAKHAAARRADVWLEYRADRVELRIDDDGRGFDVTASRRAGKHLGMLGMSERAQLVGGRLDVISRPGQGTSIVVRVPTDGARTSR